MDPEGIAQFLIKERYLLTALEFYAEMCEAGKDIPSLRKFFGNASNFEVAKESSGLPTMAYSAGFTHSPTSKRHGRG